MRPKRSLWAVMTAFKSSSSAMFAGDRLGVEAGFCEVIDRGLELVGAARRDGQAVAVLAQHAG